MPDLAASEDQLLDAVASAHRARRGRDAARRLWRIAPLAAAAGILVAAGGRAVGWTPFVTLLLLAGAAVALAAFTLSARRGRAITDGDVARLDADAGLQGELRSAHWFARGPERDDWIRLHLIRAASRARTIDWRALYPAPAARRAKLVTAVMAAAAIALAIFVPAGRAAASAARPTRTAATRRPGVPATLPADLRRALDELLAAAESRDGRHPSAADVRALLARLDDLARRDPAAREDAAAGDTGRPDATGADMKALAARAKKAAENSSLEPAVRDALADVADRLSDGDQNADAMGSRDPEDAAAGADATGQAQPSKAGGGAPDSSASVQQAREAAGGSGAGVVMMTTEDASGARDGGLGLGGGSSDRNGGGRLADLGAALRKETIEASADLPGDNVLTEQHRRTEQAAAAAAFTGAAARTAARGTSTAPPPVPESRRAAVKSYFLRKQ